MNYTRILTTVVLSVVGLAFIVSSSSQGEAIAKDKSSPPTVVAGASPPAAEPAVRVDASLDEVESGASAQASGYSIEWSSINSGGATSSSSSSYSMGHSAGQSVAGSAGSSGFDVGIGFWYGATGGACPIAMTGDVNNSGSITSADIIYCVNYVFKGGATPLPCTAAADVNCSGSVTSADIIYLVNFVFKGGNAPCDVCTLIPGSWSCP